MIKRREWSEWTETIQFTKTSCWGLWLDHGKWMEQTHQCWRNWDISEMRGRTSKSWRLHNPGEDQKVLLSCSLWVLPAQPCSSWCEKLGKLLHLLLMFYSKNIKGTYIFSRVFPSKNSILPISKSLLGGVYYVFVKVSRTGIEDLQASILVCASM